LTVPACIVELPLTVATNGGSASRVGARLGRAGIRLGARTVDTER
jgi:hypothetical protein